jgi:serine/threonine-protein kinase HipA
MNALEVFLHADRVGRLERLPGAELRFRYDSAWLSAADVPLSLSLPLREEAFADRECRPFFAGLLPEGDFLKSIARAFHISAENPFTVLEEIGGECAGAVSLVTPGNEPPFAVAAPPEWLSGEGLEQLLANLPSRPLLIGPGDDEGVRLSLAGTRDKLPLLLDGDRVGVTRGRPPSTHIVKTPIPTVPEMVANEAYCMALANEVGLRAASAAPIRAGDQEALLVERYDRTRRGHGIHRVHQEDLCQASGKAPGEKYEAEGGPGVAACAELIRSHAAAPGPTLLRFLDALLFNALIGNADAHSKNYSLLLDGPGAPQLAPLYDLLSTRVYDRRFGRKMAMKYGGEYRPDRIRGRHLDRMGADLGIAARRVRKHAIDISGIAVASAEKARARLPGPWQDARVIDGIVEVIEEFAEVLRQAAAEQA